MGVAVGCHEQPPEQHQHQIHIYLIFLCLGTRPYPQPVLLQRHVFRSHVGGDRGEAGRKVAQQFLAHQVGGRAVLAWLVAAIPLLGLSYTDACYLLPSCGNM